MPVQFTCSHCRRRLSVAQRKAGTTVACPKCGLPNVVPSAPPAGDQPPPVIKAELPATAEAPAIVQSASPPEKAPAPAPSADAAFDDVVRLLTESEPAPPRTSPARQSTPPLPPALGQFATALPAAATPPPIPPIVAVDARSPAPPPLGPRVSARRRGRQGDEGAVLVLTRKAIYAQAALALAAVTVAFFAGLAIGRSGGAGSKSAAETKTTDGEPVPLDGYVLYSLSPGQSLPDAGATIIALPEGKKPAHKIAARGLRPGDKDEDPTADADELQSLGAAVARTDDTGQFQLVAPRPGDYKLVIVSHRASRPEGHAIAMADQEQLSRVFASPSELIGQRRYVILSRHLAGSPPRLTHEFGPTDKR